MIVDMYNYITATPGFWLSMGVTASIGTIIGGLLYNGDFPRLKKGLITSFFYGLLLSIVIYSRVEYVKGAIGVIREYVAYSGIGTIVFISIFYFSGMSIGVAWLNHLKHRTGDRA